MYLGLLFCVFALSSIGQALNATTLILEVVVKYPDENLGGLSLYIRGDGLGLNWNQGQPMLHSGSKANEWHFTFEYFSQDVGQTLSFKTLVADAKWQIGSNEKVVLPSSSGLVTSYPFYLSQSGSYAVTTRLHSSRLGNNRDVIVYFPPSYQENTLKSYADVLIMHDGENLFNDSTSFGGIAWRCQDTVDALIASGGMREIIIVGLYNTAGRIDEYTYSYDASVMGGGKGDLYLDFIEAQAIPWIRNNLRITANAKLGIMGSSLGGLISCYAGWTRPSIYSVAGCISSSFWWNNEDFNNTVLNKPRKTESNPQTVFYLDSGDQGEGQDDKVQTVTVRTHFESLGWTLGRDLFYYLAKGGSHNEKSWGERFYVPMTDLYPTMPLTL
jgi:predicted alpha/beta superfamily hydrolase